jgi:ribosomal protein S18 acetylase RimI-like enzyme
LPEEQGKGTGKALMQFAEQHVLSLGKTRLSLNVNRNNIKAKQFYERQGFHIIAEVDIPYRSYLLNDYIMEKVLI